MAAAEAEAVKQTDRGQKPEGLVPRIRGGESTMTVPIQLRVAAILLWITAVGFGVFCLPAIALIAGLGLPWSEPAGLLLLNGFFIALFAGSAWLFRRAARG
jgi:hypothetical protein